MPRRPPPRKRPYPPDAVFERPWGRFTPAPEVLEWLREEVIGFGGQLHNPDHQHLQGADLAVLWAPGGMRQKGRTVIGTAEELMFRCNAWQRERQEQQLRDWFGGAPRYLITLDATYCLNCTDADFCALVEHEIYHVAHLGKAEGIPAFTKEGKPRLFIRGHDVEEFVGVVKRYGVGDPDGALAKLAAAARGIPEVSRSAIAGACGTCLLRAA